jgi:EmrB/QacA subfamily drug resistance transporter
MTATMADQAILEGEQAAGGLARQHGAPEDWVPQEPGTGPFVPEDVHRRRWAILAVLCLSLVLIVMDNTILNVALPSLVNDLGATNSQLQWIVDSYVLVFAGLLLTAGALGDRFGRKGALTLGLAIFGLGSVASTLVDSSSGLIVTRAIMGLGGAFIMPATLSLLTNVFRDPKERARAIAIWAGCAGLGVAIGPVVGGLLLEHYSWHSVFLINVPVIVLAIVAGWFLVPTSRDPDAPRIDLPGAALSIGGLVALVWSLIEAPRYGWTDPVTLIGFAVAAVLLTAFILWELYTEHPMLDMRFFRNPRFSAANSAITLTFFAMFGSFFLLTQYLQFVKGFSPLEAGVRLVPMAFVMMIVAPISARVVERVGTKIVVGGGLAIAAGGLLLMSTLETSTSYAGILVRMVVLAIGMGLVMAPATEAVMGSLPPEKAGVGSAVNDTTREIGGALGVAVIGSLVSTAYASSMAGSVTGLPAPAQQAAEESLGAALMIAQQMGSAGTGLAEAARQAFVDALGNGLLVGAAVAAVAAVIVAIALPARAHDALPVEDVLAPAGPVGDDELSELVAAG